MKRFFVLSKNRFFSYLQKYLDKKTAKTQQIVSWQ